MRPARIALALLFVSFRLCADEPAFDMATAFGFNWLQPDSAVCARLTEQEIRSAHCEAHENAFGLSFPYRACKQSRDVELLIFRSEAECTEALETMQANAP